MKFISSKSEVLEAIRQKEERALDAVGLFVVGRAKLNAPYITGLLRKSIDHKVEDTSVIIGSDVQYAEEVEVGTRTKKAKPYLEPAVMKNVSQIKKLIEDYLKD